MKLYLSSYHLGSRPSELAELFGANKKVGLIQNAADVYGDGERPKYRDRYLEDLAAIGLEGQEIDLRNFVGKRSELEQLANGLGGLYVVGGNTFSLSTAMRESGAYEILHRLRSNQDFVYAGFSAGICVLSKNLEGIHLADRPDLVPHAVWEGAGLIDVYLVPHWRSNHAESEMMEDVAKFYQNKAMKYRCSKDGEVLIMDSEDPFVRHLGQAPLTL